MKSVWAGLLFLSGMLLILSGDVSGQSSASSNDHIFPAAAVARPFIDFDSKGFLVRGQRVFLVSAGIEYARVPRELWHDRLLRLKRAGFNCIEIYTFWNFHEPHEGQFDFSGDHDLDAFLQMVNGMGMYAIVRVGPYYCAEWDNGGYPLWLRFKEGVRVREDNEPFKKYTDRFFDRLLPIVMKNQIHHGGAVILVQLENEHIEGWGTAMPNGYFRHLREKALSMGLEVPYFFSGLHHSSDPAGNRPGDPVDPTAGVVGGVAEPAIGVPVAGTPESKPLHGVGKAASDPMALDDPSRPNPWFSSEFWSVWFTGYSSDDKQARDWGRRTWKIIAHGGGGYNYYMAYGGSNFGYTNNDEDAASYDYGAAVGQAGDLRPIYYTFKRAALFAGSFREILANSEDATAQYTSFLSNTALNDTAIRITARHSPAGDIVFLDNPSGKAASARIAGPGGTLLPAEAPLVLAPGEIVPLVHHFSLTSAVTLDWSAARILGIARQGATVTIVIFGEPGSQGEMHFSTKGQGAARIIEGGEGRDDHFLSSSGFVDLRVKFSASVRAAVYSFTVGSRKVRVLAMSRQLADCSWFIEKNGVTDIVCGADYAGESGVAAERSSGGGTEGLNRGKPFSVSVEKPWEGSGEFPVELFGTQAPRKALRGVREHAEEHVTGVALGPWEVSEAWGCSTPGYDDHDWKASEDPLQMGADGDLSADAWYRTKINAPDSGEYTLQVEGSDRATAFVDGVRSGSGSAGGRPGLVGSGSGSIRTGELSFRLTKGAHALTIFTAHDGRDKLAAYLGPIDSSDRKGLFGRAVLKKGGPSIHTVSGWHFLRASSAKDVEHCPAPGMVGWEDYTIGQDAFAGKEGFGWFRARVDSLPAGVSKIALAFRSVDENATVFVNGHRIGGQDGWNRPFLLVADKIDTVRGDVILTVFISNYSNEGGIDQPVRVNSLGDAIPVTGWRMRGGPGDPAAITDWKNWPGEETKLRPGGDGNDGDTAAAAAGPCFYRNHFMTSSYGVTGAHPIWRVMTSGLGHGSVWVNGHNLGRYPEKTPAPGVYIPECWLKDGDNTLVIYDEDGRAPGRVSILAEKAAGRDLEMLSEH